MVLAAYSVLSQLFMHAPNLAPAALCAGAALLAGLMWLYWPQVKSGSRGWRWALLSLRAAVVIVLAGSIVKPVAVRLATASERGAIVVLIDRSKSMSVTDNARTPAQLVALADALGQLPAGARGDVDNGLRVAIDRLRTLAAESKAAQDDLEYARVSGHDIDSRQTQWREALSRYSLAAESLANRGDSIDPESDLHRRLADLGQIPAPEAREAWRSELPAKIARAADALIQFRSAADELLYRTNPDVHRACDEVAMLSRFELTQQALLRPGGVLERLRSEADIAGFSVADVATPLDLQKNGGLVSSLGTTPAGHWTDLTSAIAESVAGRSVRAVVLFSDGRQVGGDATVVSGLVPNGVPIFTVGVSAATPPRDLSFADVRLPSSVFAGQQFPVKFELRHPGLNGIDVKVHLAVADQAEQSQILPVRDGKRPASKFYLKLAGQQVQKLRLWVDRADGEITDVNNQVERWIKIVPHRMKVLLIAGSPGWDFQFVRNALGRFPEMEALDVVVRPGSRLSLRRGEMMQQDVVVLFDLQAGALDATQWDELEQLAERKGGSVILVAGAHFPVEYGRGSPIPVSKLLPYRVLSYNPAWRVWPGESPEFHFLPAPQAQSLDALRLTDGEAAAVSEGGLSAWEQLPGAFRFVQLPEWGDRESWNRYVHPLLLESESRLPLLTEMNVGAGRAFFLGTDETWRWRFKVGERYQDRFWRQLITYASDQPYFSRSGPLALDADKVSAEPGQTVRVRARLADDSQVVSRKHVLEILHEGKVFTLRDLEPAAPVGSGRFTASVDLPAGEYVLKWTEALRNNQAVFAQIPLHVAASDEAELADLSGDERMLRKLSDATAGKFLPIEQVNLLPDQLATVGATRLRFAELPLWDSPYLFCFVLGCLGTEWAVRKRIGLA